MKHQKNIFLILGITVIAITLLAIFFPNKKKSFVGPVSAITADTSKTASIDSFRVRPLTNIKYERTAQRQEQGKYLVTGLLECFMCHSERNWDAPGAPPLVEKYGSGKLLWEDSLHHIFAPNITPDKETGAGKWTDDMFARAIREGVGHDGRALAPDMPYNTFKNLSDEDLASIIVYLRSIPPVHHVVPKTIIPTGDRSWIEKSLRPITKPILAGNFPNMKNRGHYLVSLADCGGCHTSHANYNPGIYAGGNLIDHGHGKAFSANITSDPSGMAYGPEGFIFVMRTGKGGMLSNNMPWVALKNINDSDLRAIYAYLKAMPPSQHYITNQKPFTHCVICGQDHGLGDRNKLEKPAGIKLDPDLYDKYAGTYYNKEFDFSTVVKRDGNKLIFIPWENGPKVELIPQSELHFLAPGWYLPFTFTKDKDGHVISIVEDSDEGLTYTKIK